MPPARPIARPPLARRPAGAGFALAATALLASVACSGNSSSSSQPSAVEQATGHSCDWYQMCGEIAAGKKYNTRADCEIDVRAAWNKAWPSAECDGKVDQASLDVCLKAIDITDCKNGLDLLNTLIVKCPKDRICGGTDGG